MPRPKRKVPSYRHHKASGQAVVTLNGKDVYLGPYRSDASRAEYDRLVAEWLANQRQHATTSVSTSGVEAATSELSVNELFAAYWNFASAYDRKDGRPTGELAPIRQTAKPLTALYGTTPVAQFGPRVPWRRCGRR